VPEIIVHSFIYYIFRSYYAPGTVQSTESIVMSRKDKSSCAFEASVGGDGQ
jgi:hypothetical protein